MLMMGVAEVPIAILLGVAFLSERPPTGSLLGGALVLVAVMIALGSSRNSA